MGNNNLFRAVFRFVWFVRVQENRVIFHSKPIRHTFKIPFFYWVGCPNEKQSHRRYRYHHEAGNFFLAFLH